MLWLLSVACGLSAQHPYFASLNQSYLALNPAFAGTVGSLRLQATGALQNTNTNFQNMNAFAGVDLFVPKLKSGFGLSYQANNYSRLLNKSQFDLSYAFHIRLNKSYSLVPAVQLSYFEVAQNNANTSFGDMIDVRRGFDWNTNELHPGSRSNFSVSPGLLFYGSGVFIGASILDVNRPDEGLYGVSRRNLTQIYHAGYRTLLARGSHIDAYVLAKIQAPKNNLYQYGCYLDFFNFASLHAGQRLKDALIAGCNFYNRCIKIGYNIEYHYKVYNPAKFSHEIYLSVTFSKKRGKSSLEFKNQSAPPLVLAL